MAFQPSVPGDTPGAPTPKGAQVPPLEHDFADRLPELSADWQPHPEQAPRPRLLALNEPLAAELGMDAGWLRSPAGVDFLLGHELPEGSHPVAQFYSGHQFGSFNPQMGDGRAVLLGEVRDPATGSLRDLHVKGAGTTPLTRPGGDGKAPLTAALREFLLSEFMHAAGVPTARSLAVVATGGQVTRRITEPAAAIVRVAPSHLRVGTFQAARLLDPTGERGLLRRVADMAVDRHYPQLADFERADRYVELYRQVGASQARLIAKWMRLGFIHGVMNTDNTAIAGITLDYGPAAFLDRFRPETFFSSIDTHGRYAFGRQPAIGGWNLARLAEAMLPLFSSSQDASSPADTPGSGDRESSVALEAAQAALDEYSAAFSRALTAEFADALGLSVENTQHRHLVADFQQLAEDLQVDMHQLLRRLTDEAAVADSADPALRAWVAQWRAADPDLRLMARTNPVYYPRNAHVEEVLAAALRGELAPFEQFGAALRSPFERREEFRHWEQPADPPEGFRTFCGT